MTEFAVVSAKLLPWRGFGGELEVVSELYLLLEAGMTWDGVVLEMVFCVDRLLEASNFSFRDSLVEFCEFKRDVLDDELLITNRRRCYSYLILIRYENYR